MGSKKAQTIGYRYSASGHFVLCHGPVDSIRKISFQDKDAFTTVKSSNQRIYINKPNLFGGDEQSGGIQGNVDLLFGYPDQQKSNVLKRICGDLISAWRGVTSVIFDDLYIGTSPTLPDSKWRVQRIHTLQDGQQQWYDEKAAILSKATVYFDIGYKFYTYIMSSGGTKNWTITLDKDNPPVYLAEFTESLNSSIDSGNYLINEVNDLSITWDTDGDGTRNYDPEDFYVTVTVYLYCTTQDEIDVEPRCAYSNYDYTIADETTLYYGYDLYLHLISFDVALADVSTNIGVKISNDKLQTVQRCYPITYISLPYIPGFTDINPAHIIRESLTNTLWGKGATTALMNDDSFRFCADTLYDEGMGMSIVWNDSTSIKEFIDNVLEHINGELYVDRITNLWTLKLIRDDYDTKTLQHLTERDYKKLTFERRTLAECVNQVTVTYYDLERAKDSTLTLQDIARIAQQGGVVAQDVEYTGFTNIDVASRVALRDLKTLSSELATIEFDVPENVAENWHKAYVFKLSNTCYGLYEAVFRVTEIKFGDGKNNTVSVTAVEDSFSSPMQAVVEYVPPVKNDTAAKDAIAIAFEVPYIELVEQYGQDEIDLKILNNPDLSFVGMAAVRPNNYHINASLYTDSGAGYAEEATLDFCPSATLKAAMGHLDTAFEVENVAEFANLAVGNRIQLDRELLAFVSFDDTNNILTVKRGVFGTTVQKHSAATRLYGWDSYSGLDSTEYLNGETVTMKALTLTGSDILELSEATAHAITCSSRAMRPYVPANVQINGEYFPTEITGDLILSWSHRNRTQQTGGTPLAWTEGSITLENGVTYVIELYDANNALISSTDVGNVDTATLDYSAVATATCKLKLYAMRDGYRSDQIFEHELMVSFDPPYNLTGTWNEAAQAVDLIWDFDL